MGGYYNNNKDIRLSNLLTVFDPKNGKVVQRVEATDATNMTGASAVWSSRRGTVLLFEGSRAVATGDVNALVQTAVKEYDTVTGQWKTFETKGTFPTRRLDACAVESDDGAKIIFFGGAVDANVFLNTIHILDVDSGQWTLGQPAPTGTRSQMACAFHSGFFVAFGGTTGSKNQTEEMYTSQPIVYDVNQNQWVDSFSVSDGSGAGSSSSLSGSSMDPVLWTGVGAIVFMMLCALVGDYLNAKRRRERKAIEKNARTMDMLSDSEDHHSSRRRTIHRRANSQSLHRVMTPAEHYAAAQAAAELQIIREAALAAAAAATGGANEGDNSGDGGDGDGKEDNRARSWGSETFSQTASAGALSSLSGDDSISLASVALTQRSSNDRSPPASAVDPQMYYLQLMNQQRALQSMTPAGAAAVNVGPAITTAGLYRQQQQQQDRVLRSPQSPRMGSEILPERTVGGGGGDSLSSPGGGAGSAKAISFSLSSPPATPRRAPHTVV
ncbi:hypothetical protein BGW39_001323 [Mortierella sp. 14UC]|nr:hypothetical protein BGW39_001323 [Mortierella sp. 14UC]